MASAAGVIYCHLPPSTGSLPWELPGGFAVWLLVGVQTWAEHSGLQVEEFEWHSSERNPTKRSSFIYFHPLTHDHRYRCRSFSPFFCGLKRGINPLLHTRTHCVVFSVEEATGCLHRSILCQVGIYPSWLHLT